MDNSDLLDAIDIVRDALMSDDEEEQFQRIIDRLEGYELAYGVLLKKIERYEKALNECIHQNGLMDFLDKNSWACQEDYFIHIGKTGLYGK